MKKFTPAETLQVVLEGEARSGQDQSGLVVVGEIAPQTADHERLHGGAGPGLHAGADTEAEAASHVWIVAERHLVAAEGEPSISAQLTAMVASGSMNAPLRNEPKR
ncbi:MAG TPA: hypothetical protein VFJ49_04390 [Methyloceanibacter sp.]|nr:hypothetical protein [Methyloceanibacter sp.]